MDNLSFLWLFSQSLCPWFSAFTKCLGVNLPRILLSCLELVFLNLKIHLFHQF